MTDVVDVIFNLTTQVVEVIIPDVIFSYAPPILPVPFLVLSNNTLAEDSAPETVVGELSVSYGVGTYAFSITSDPDNIFSLDTPFEETTGFLDYEVQPSHLVTIQADNGAGGVLTQTFTIAVTDVVDSTEPPAPSGITTTMTVGRGIYITQTTARQYMSPSGVYINEEL